MSGVSGRHPDREGLIAHSDNCFPLELHNAAKSLGRVCLHCVGSCSLATVMFALVTPTSLVIVEFISGRVVAAISLTVMFFVVVTLASLTVMMLVSLISFVVVVMLCILLEVGMLVSLTVMVFVSLAL